MATLKKAVGLLWKGAFYLLGPSITITGIVLMVLSDQSQGKMKAASPASDFAFLGLACKVEQVDWRAIVEIRKNGRTCKDEYSCVLPPYISSGEAEQVVSSTCLGMLRGMGTASTIACDELTMHAANKRTLCSTASTFVYFS
jgi:hypothetical protein